MSETCPIIEIYPPEGNKFVECIKCKNPCVVGVDENRNVCLMCLIMEEMDS
jgi:hypothetical protein